MDLRRIVAMRVALGAVAAWVILTVVFLLFTLTDDWVLNADLALMRLGDTPDEAIEAVRQQYFQERGLDKPLWRSYLDWLASMVTLDWGESFETGEPALSVVLAAVGRTAMYVLPGFAVAVGLGVLIGLTAALYRHERLPGLVVVLVYIAFVAPMFWIGGLALSLDHPQFLLRRPNHWAYTHALPIMFTAATLLGGYVSYVRAHSLEYAGREFTKLVRAKGATNRRVAAHVLRNAAIPFFSMLFTEVILLLLVAVFVIEAMFGIDGFGVTFLEAARRRDLPVLLGSTIVVIALGVVGNVIQDVSYSYFDPRVDTGRR
ncbi:MAG: ABC transporter permease [Halobacteriota archaeon]